MSQKITVNQAIKPSPERDGFVRQAKQAHLSVFVGETVFCLHLARDVPGRQVKAVDTYEFPITMLGVYLDDDEINAAVEILPEIESAMAALKGPLSINEGLEMNKRYLRRPLIQAAQVLKEINAALDEKDPHRAKGPANTFDFRDLMGPPGGAEGNDPQPG